MENFTVKEIEFEDKDLNYLISCLKLCYYNHQTNFAKTCFVIHSIWSYCKNSYFRSKTSEYYNCNLLLAKFGFDRKAVSRYKACFERFCEGTCIENVFVKEPFFKFSPSKLFELLPLSEKTLNDLLDKNVITCYMTVKQIREVIKSLSSKQAEKVIEENIKIDESEIPDVYDPTKKYEYSYFESKTKNQLLNIVWELQKTYQKLKNKKENKDGK